MMIASELAGFCAAHAALNLAQADGFTPMLAYTNEKDERVMERLAGEDAERIVAWGKEKLDSNEMDANDVVFLYGAQITHDAEQTPAIIVEMRAYFMAGAEATIVVPYTPKSSGQFRIHKPFVAVWKECEDFSKDAALALFFKGIGQYKQGAENWRAAWDSST